MFQASKSLLKLDFVLRYLLQRPRSTRYALCLLLHIRLQYPTASTRLAKQHQIH
jgi:hypothetical protein